MFTRIRAHQESKIVAKAVFKVKHWEKQWVQRGHIKVYKWVVAEKKKEEAAKKEAAAGNEASVRGDSGNVGEVESSQNQGNGNAANSGVATSSVPMEGIEGAAGSEGASVGTSGERKASGQLAAGSEGMAANTQKTSGPALLAKNLADMVASAEAGDNDSMDKSEGASMSVSVSESAVCTSISTPMESIGDVDSPSCAPSSSFQQPDSTVNEDFAKESGEVKQMHAKDDAGDEDDEKNNDSNSIASESQSNFSESVSESPSNLTDGS
eukprot:Nk52_evm4s162 gene=Nk52_evmTU4s162